MATFAKDATLDTYDSDGFKKAPNVDGRLQMSVPS
jgi:hypothetical protein